jgi:hypothetical protein
LLSANTAPAEADTATAPIQKYATINVGTYNVLKDAAPVNMKRAHNAMDIINGKRGTPGFDIWGAQEMTHAQEVVFSNDPKMDDFESLVAPNGNPENAIWYKPNMFKLEDHGGIKYSSYGDRNLATRHGDGVWGLFTDRETGQQFITINAHLPAWNGDPGSDPGAALKREVGAEILQDVIAELKEKYPGMPIFLVGDLNSTRVTRTTDKETPRPKDPALHGDRTRIPYCIITEHPGYIQDTRDMVKGIYGHCKNNENDGLIKYTVDWIYADPKNTEVKRWQLNTDLSGSDHRALVSVIKLLNPSPAQPLKQIAVKQPVVGT